ncbi:MAG: von Willebrand factor type A domain-containing protein [Sandaracinaceae bacterium]|nr:von Willebrand factor type A domain-containing protein [Sandaracinaceae bacterium]
MKADILRFALVCTLLAGCNDGGAYSGPPYPPAPGSDAGVRSGPPGADAGAPFPGDVPDAGGDTFDDVGTNPFVMASHDPFSTFGADVDTASYDIFVRDALEGSLPSPLSVRLEEYVNAFDYDYPTPEPDAEIPFSIDLVAAQHPLRSDIAQLRIGIQASRPPEFEQLPTNLVFLVDTSGSMDEIDKLPLAQLVIRETVGALNGTDTISIVTYGPNTRVVLGPTRASDAALIDRAVGELAASGGTDGGAGIQMAYAQATAGWIEGGFNHVVLMTDGDFNIGITDTEALVTLIEEERATGITLTALGFGTGNLNDAMMERVSNSGNGVYSVITSADHARRYAQEDILRTAHFVAQDMKIQVEFNPDHVLAYRLLGYENRAIDDMLFRDDTVDAGEVGAGLRVTALYEVVLRGQSIPEVEGAPAATAGDPVEGERAIEAHELVEVRVRWKDRGATESDPAQETLASLTPDDVFTELFTDSDADFLWASALAGFAELVKGSPYADIAQLDRIHAIVSAQRDRDTDRAQFVELFEAVRSQLETP